MDSYKSRQCYDCQDDPECHCWQEGDKVKLQHGTVTWHGVVRNLEKSGLVLVEWGTGVRERVKPDELERDDRG